jgi:WD40 repeat protein
MSDISVDIEVDKIDIDKSDIDKNNVDKIFTFDDKPHNGDKIDIDKSDIDKNNDDKIFIFDDKSHNGKPITNIEVSPKGKYLVTFSKEDLSFVGWNVVDLDKGQIELDNTIQEVRIDNINVKSIDTIRDYGIRSLCVSDDKKLVYIYGYNWYIGQNNEGK